MSKMFISLGDAAAMLLGAGLTVKLDERTFEGHANPSKGLTVLVDGTEVAVGWGYRDGTSWKFKAEHIEEFVEEYERTKLKARFLPFGSAPQAKERGYSKMIKEFTGTLAELLREYGHQDVLFVESGHIDPSFVRGEDRFVWYVVGKGESNG